MPTLKYASAYGAGRLLRALDGVWPSPFMAQASVYSGPIFHGSCVLPDSFMSNLDKFLWNPGLQDNMWVILSHSAITEKSRWFSEDSNPRRPHVVNVSPARYPLGHAYSNVID